MSAHEPDPIPPAEVRRRRVRAVRLARSLGFVGRVEYRHVYAPTGGAQYGRGSAAGGDLLWLSAEAFERDAAGDDFSLRAFIAHERGHQLLARHPRLSVLTAGVSLAAEEVLGALVLAPGPDRDALLEKAAFDVLRGGVTASVAARVIGNLWNQLETLL